MYTSAKILYLQGETTVIPIPLYRIICRISNRDNNKDIIQEIIQDNDRDIMQG